MIPRSCLALGVVLLPSAAFAQAPTALVEEGDVVAGIGAVTSISNLAVNDGGEWLVEVDTDNADSEADGVMLKSGAELLREGDSLALPVGATLDFFDSVTLNASGNSGWNFFLDGTSGSGDDSGIYFNDGLLIQESELSTAPEFSPGTPYIGFFETKIDDSDRILVMASVDDPGIASSVDRGLVILTLDGSGNLVSESVFAKEGDTLAGQTETVGDFETGPHNFDFNNLADLLFIADLTGDTNVDHAVYLNDTLLAQEGSASPVPLRNWATLASAEVSLNDNRGHVISGALDGDSATNLLIATDQGKLVQEGDSLADISPHTLTSFGTGPVVLANNGDVLWYGNWTDPDTDVDSGLFVNDDLVVQEGVTTVGGIVIDSLSSIQDGYTISPNGRYVVFEATLMDGTNGAYMVDRGPLASTALRNGTGANAVCYTSTSLPVLGSNWTAEIDASNHAGAGLTLIVGYEAPLAPFPIAAGEILVDITRVQVLASTAPSGGGVAVHSNALPNDVALAGKVVYTQGVILGGGLELCNAIDVWLGN